MHEQSRNEEKLYRFFTITGPDRCQTPSMTRNSSIHPASGDLTRLLETERRLAPALESAVTSMRRTLDEREREERLRLKHMRSSRVPHGLFKPEKPRSLREVL